MERAGEAEMDEMWSFVGNKSNPRWLLHAIESLHRKGLGLRLWSPHRRSFDSSKRCSSLRADRDYKRILGRIHPGIGPEVHRLGKRNTQKIERKHLTLRTRIKRLCADHLLFEIDRRCMTCHWLV